MRTKRIVTTYVLAVGGVFIQSAASAQEYRGTYEQRMACTPDVWRFCSDQVPDVNRIVACLRQNAPQLSDGCRAVFETTNSAPPVARGRVAPPPGYYAQRPSPYYDQGPPLPPPRYDDEW